MRNMSTLAKIGMAAVGIAAAIGISVAQSGTGGTPTAPAKSAVPNGFGTMHLTTHVGSFRVASPGSDPARGKMDMQFTGTVLVSGLRPGGTVVPSGNVKREYWDEKHNKQVWHGTGHLVIDGAYKGIQWFGRDLNATWVGFGIMLLYGEFDKNLETGYVWYDDPKQKRFWSTFGQQLTNPEAKQQGAGVVPRQRSGGGG